MSGDSYSNKTMGYAVAASVAVVVFVLFFVNLDFIFLAALLWALVAGGLVILALTWGARGSGDAEAPLPPPQPVSRPPEPAPKPAADTAQPEAKASADEAAKAPETAPATGDDTATTPGAAAGSPDKARPTAPQAGQAEVATPEGHAADEGEGTVGAGEDSPGTRPATLDAPRDGGADDLKKIRGIGPKLEQMLHGMGIFHYDQIADWSEDEIAWVDANLEGFKGRVTRDAWVGQAAMLARGSAGKGEGA
jgi:NADH-quinone oxidoreductase subunit E